jgi:hypothetical protein
MNARKSNFSLCRHTKTNGRLCNAAALPTSAFCHFHQKLRRNRRSTVSTGPGLSTNVLHPLRNAESIQQALSMVLSGLASGQIDTRRGGKMIYLLQLAASDLRRSSLE